MPGVCDVLRDPAARILLLSWFFMINAFIWFQFVSAWTIEHITHSTRLVQFTGFCQMGPMIFGPLVGKLADRLDKLCERTQPIILTVM